MMGAGVSVVMIPPIESTGVESYDENDQLVSYKIASA